MTIAIGTSLTRAMILITVLALASCSPSGPVSDDSARPASPGASGASSGGVPPSSALNVVATTTLVGDIVSRVAGDGIELRVLLPPGADPHGFEPTPRDVAAVADADIVFANGLGLETFLEPLLANAGGQTPVVTVSDGIDTLALSAEHHDDESEEHGNARDGDTEPSDHASNGDGEDGDGASSHELGVDPHVWFDPANVAIWAANISTVLGEHDPDSAATYVENTEVLIAELADLDAWIEEQTNTFPRKRRQLVTDHDTLGYFAHRYGFAQIGTLHGFSTMSEPSAAEMARLEDDIRAFDVPAIFVGTTVRADLAERIADDTGTKVVRLYTGSLSEPGGAADSYDAFMRSNVSAIVAALAPESTLTGEP